MAGSPGDHGLMNCRCRDSRKSENGCLIRGRGLDCVAPVERSVFEPFMSLEPLTVSCSGRVLFLPVVLVSGHLFAPIHILVLFPLELEPVLDADIG